MTKRYYGSRLSEGQIVVAVAEGSMAKVLPPRNDLDNHSPDGFNWGYEGSGPAQLALAILADALGNDERAIRLHQRFKARTVATWGEDWTIDADEVRRIADEIEHATPDSTQGA